ncbi:PleD family two-component system response regulator [Mucilaginibacter sp. RCC_168]|uniref:response regulator n=1 Tax=Mucilaginibacter sp. RCC_168 TaxID=3239221 RepID=UPI0035264705
MNMRLLLIDDDAALLDLLTEVFETEGYHVTAVAEVKDLAGLLESSRPDLIITDYYLKNDCNGRDLCCQIRRLALFAELPIIMLSAWPKAKSAWESKLCQVLVSKPFDVWELLACTGELIRLRQT